MTAKIVEIAKYYGKRHQIEKFIEECSEAIQAMQKYKENPDNTDCYNHVCEEIADVCIMSEQMRLFFDVDKQIDYKINRQIERMNKKC